MACSTTTRWACFIAGACIAAASWAQADPPGSELTLATKGKTGSAQTRQLVVDGVQRDYLIQTLERAGGARPVVVLLHGGTQTPSQVWRQTSLPTLAAEEGFILVAPQGLKRQWNDGRGSTISGTESDADDLAFLHALIGEVVAHDHGDARAVFMVGISNGGFMTMDFGCRHADDLRAAATVVANLPVEVAKACAPARPLPWLAMNGTSDPLIPFEGQPAGTLKLGHPQAALLSADESFNFWADHAHCAPAVKSSTLPGATATVWAEQRTREGCAGGTASVQYVFHGSGHSWPGVRNGPVMRALGGASQAVDAGSAIWGFFKATLPAR